MLTSRQGQLITRIVEKYIRLAEPVSSKFLEKSGFLGLSSATIRAEMCELEELGYLTHLHTSGGRVPTDSGYRYFVNNLKFPISLPTGQAGNFPAYRTGRQFPKYVKKIRNAINEAGENPRGINRVVAQTLSELSENLVITGIEEEQDFFKVGLASLFEMPEFREFDRIFRITNFFDEFEKTFAELESMFFSSPFEVSAKKGATDSKQTARADDDVKVFIGRENPVPDIRDGTVMFARYNLPRGLTGSLTLIGPTRMDYAKNIGLIKYTMGELNRLAKQA